jgi:outer membrane protein
MKNLSLVLNGVLIIAVAILYYMHFAKPKTAGEDVAIPTTISVSGTGIVYVNSDSLLSEYEFYKKQKEDFEQQHEKIKAELKGQSDKLQSEVETYQKQAIGMTDLEKSKKEEELGMKQQQLMQTKDELLGKLDEEQAKSSEQLYDRLNDYLRRYNKGKNYNYILGYQKGGGILFANDSLNITRDVIEGLNKEYKSNNEEAK